MAGPSYFRGVTPTRVTPESASAPLVIDISGVLSAALLMHAAYRVTTDPKFRDSIAENAMRSLIPTFENEVQRRAKDDGRMSTKHVFKWVEVEDQVNKFKVTKVKATKANQLYVIPPKPKNNKMDVVFFKNDQEALIDPRVESLARRPDTIGRHHFKDQSEELESVSFIQKDSAKVSKRRLDGFSGHARWSDKGRLKKRRIVGISEGGDGLSYYRMVNRANPFFGNFKRVFYDFYTTKASVNMVSAFNRSVKQMGMPETVKIGRQKMKASERTMHFGLGKVDGKMTGIKPTIVLTDRTFRSRQEQSGRDMVEAIVQDLDSHVSSAYDSRTTASIMSKTGSAWRE